MAPIHVFWSDHVQVFSKKKIQYMFCFGMSISNSLKACYATLISFMPYCLFSIVHQSYICIGTCIVVESRHIMWSSINYFPILNALSKTTARTYTNSKSWAMTKIIWYNIDTICFHNCKISKSILILCHSIYEACKCM